MIYIFLAVIAMIADMLRLDWNDNETTINKASAYADYIRNGKK